jgi:hypothetical protein
LARGRIDAERLLVADVPAPFVLEVDQATVEPITGLPSAAS